jgi:hypothetical protein
MRERTAAAGEGSAAFYPRGAPHPRRFEDRPRRALKPRIMMISTAISTGADRARLHVYDTPKNSKKRVTVYAADNATNPVKPALSQSFHVMA